jgi:hypothetical protein
VKEILDLGGFGDVCDVEGAVQDGFAVVILSAKGPILAAMGPETNGVLAA